jgi:hypothetical protein
MRVNEEEDENENSKPEDEELFDRTRTMTNNWQGNQRLPKMDACFPMTDWLTNQTAKT